MRDSSPSQRVRVARLSDSALSVEHALAAVADPAAGGLGLFVGVVRNHDGGASVQRLEYSAHPGAQDVLRGCAEQVAAAHDVTAISVVHRVGTLEVGDRAVVVAVSAAHRAPALEACRALIDDLKAQVPIWKRQVFADGTSEWVGL